MDEATKYLVSQGVLAVCLLALALWHVRREKENKDDKATMRAEHESALKNEREQKEAALLGRNADSKASAAQAMDMQKAVLEYVAAAKAADDKATEKLVELRDEIRGLVNVLRGTDPTGGKR